MPIVECRASVEVAFSTSPRTKVDREFSYILVVPTSIGKHRLKSPLSPLVPLLLGLTCIGGAVGLQQQQQAVQRADVRDIAGLRSELDSVRAAVARTPAGPDSTRLVQSVAKRAFILGRRELHVPTRQESIDQ